MQFFGQFILGFLIKGEVPLEGSMTYIFETHIEIIVRTETTCMHTITGESYIIRKRSNNSPGYFLKIYENVVFIFVIVHYKNISIKMFSLQ